MAAVGHDIGGLQHASMAIFNAFCDRAPILVLGATGPMDATRRRPWIDWIHTALVQGTQVRDYVKLDDQPASIAALPEAFLRAWRVARTEPMGPVYLCLDAGLQAPAPYPPTALPDPPPSQRPTGAGQEAGGARSRVAALGRGVRGEAARPAPGGPVLLPGQRRACRAPPTPVSCGLRRWRPARSASNGIEPRPTGWRG